MNPLAAVWRWVKAGLYLITGQIDKSRLALDKNPTVMKAKFDDVIKSKVDQIHTYKQAVAKLIAQQEKKMAKLKALTEETKKLETKKRNFETEKLWSRETLKPTSQRTIKPRSRESPLPLNIPTLTLHTSSLFGP